MKKLLLACSLLASIQTFGQSYWNYKDIGITDSYDQFKAAASTNVILDKGSNDVLSGTNNIPFQFTFGGKVKSAYKVSDNGYLTFDLTETVAQKTPVALPSASAPKDAIFALWSDMECIGNTQYTGERSQVFSYTYGSSPKRVHVVQWYGMAKKGVAPDGSNIIFTAVRLYEAGGFDIIYGGKAGSISGLAGYQNDDASAASMIGNSANFAYPIASAEITIFDNPEMIVYKFISGTQPNQDVFLRKATIPVFVEKNKNQKISFDIQNLGKNDLSALKINYSVDGAAAVTGQLADLNTANSGGLESFDLPSPITFATSGKKSIKVWVSSPNNLVDQNNANDTLVIATEVFDKLFPRKVLHEIFTSSTCPPCKPGNEKLSEVINANSGKWNVIKYQVNFPGTGDPYYTSEVGTRFSYYGASFAPWLTVDGGFNENSNSYSQSLFDGFASKGSLVEIKASHTISGKTITVSGTVTPNQANTTANLKLRIAIVENRTEKNVKSNGETEFFNVMKKMLPNASGTTLSLSAGTPVAFNQSYTVPGNYRLPTDGQTANIINLASENSVEEIGNLFAIVFVEDDTKKEVWQSEASNIVFPLSVKNENKNDDFTIFPNPAQNNFNIEFTKSVNGTVKVLDLSGKLVLNTNINSMNETVDCSNLNNGLYIVKIEANGIVYTQKLNITK
jgi:hypothetical protein